MPQQNKLKIWLIAALIILIILAVGGIGLWQIWQNYKTAKQETQKQTDTLEIQLAGKTLNQFFSYLHDKKFDKALELFEPSDEERGWESMESFSPTEERNDKVKMLKNYCEVVGTCFKSKVLEVKKINDAEYELTAQFIEDNGSVFVLGPCCGATEEEMPAQKEFKYKVKKINGDFKVTNAPVYRP